MADKNGLFGHGKFFNLLILLERQGAFAPKKTNLISICWDDGVKTMLSMKTLRVAIVTMGSALLLGSGMAFAQTPAIDLDGEMDEAPSPILVATQTIPADADATSMSRHVNLGTDAAIAISPGIRLEAEDRYFLRVALGGGAIFRAQPTVSNAGTVERVQGGSGMAQAVFRLGLVEVDAVITVSIADNIGLPSASEGTYTATMTIHNEQFDAIDGIAAIRSIGGEGVPIIRAVSGIASSVTSTTVTSDVGAGFLWFVNQDADAIRAGKPNASNVELGTASAVANAMGEVLDVQGMPGGSEPAGTVVEDADLIDADMGVRISVSGDFSIGAFDLITTADDGASPPIRTATCGAGDFNRVGSAETPGMGELQPLEDDPTTAMTPWMAPGGYQLCLEVDVAGMGTNASPIPATEYTATVYTRAAETGMGSVASEGTIAVIERNGASASIAYLTTSEKHNQRLIIVNNGNRPFMLTDVDFQTEDGTEADLTDAAKAAAALPDEARQIGKGESMTIKVSDMVSITGDSRRAAAVLSFNARAADVTVATTQVNLLDSSTDTVMWPVN